MPRATRLTALAIVAAASLMGACKKKPEVAPAPAPVTPTETCDAACMERRRAEEVARTAAAEKARLDSIAAARAGAVAAVRATLVEKIMFNYDQSDLSDAAKATLDAKIAILRANPQLRIRIGGHADSRGSDEYNLALGQRRAAQAKRYITDQGIDGLRIDIASFGEEQPAAQGDSEDAYAQNRRGEFEIIAGGDTITVPQ